MIEIFVELGSSVWEFEFLKGLTHQIVVCFSLVSQALQEQFKCIRLNISIWFFSILFSFFRLLGLYGFLVFLLGNNCIFLLLSLRYILCRAILHFYTILWFSIGHWIIEIAKGRPHYWNRVVNMFRPVERAIITEIRIECSEVLLLHIDEDSYLE